MLIVPVPVGPWQANCYTVATSAGNADEPVDCVVIDAGMSARPVVEQVLAQFGLRLAAVIATHGHLDHVADAAAIADAAGVPVFIHPADEHLLRHPADGLSGELAALARQAFGDELAPPASVHHLKDRTPIEVAGLRFGVTEAPGHTAGSVLLRLDGVAIEPGPQHTVPVVFTGDVVFAGSIGRTDLPGSDPDAMARTLETAVLALPDEAYLLPGHGPATTMAAERASNPYLQI